LMVWSQIDNLQTPPIVTFDFVYFRLTVDNSIKVYCFGKIQKDREKNKILIPQV
jgi:hypothetical protein